MKGTGKMFKRRGHKTKSLSVSVLVVVQLAGTWIAVAQNGLELSTKRQSPITVLQTNQVTIASNDHTAPAIAISRRVLDFECVSVGSVKELSFAVQNVADGTLQGAADASAPFHIIGGSPYSLKESEIRVITVQYAPRATGIHMSVIHLNGVTVTVMGSAVQGSPAPRSPTVPARRRAPSGSPNPRMIAGR